MSRIEDALQNLNLHLPKASAPAANYVPFVRSDNLLFISGQVSMTSGGAKYLGKLGAELDTTQGSEAARIAMLNILAQLKKALNDDLDRAVRCIRIGGFVNATPDFQDHPKVLNGASDLIVSVMGEDGQHSRYAVGVTSLPFNVAVEIEAIFEIR